MGRLLSDFIKDENGHPYRSSKANRAVNTFTASGTGGNTLTPPTTGDRIVITNFLASTDTEAIITLAGSLSTPIPFYLSAGGNINNLMNGHAPIIGEIGENFSAVCTFTGAVTGNSMATISGYPEEDQTYSG